ncbi:MAG: 13E12 repeat family protein [Actinomycetota bacterium]|nr:13E12 repeat family protein [Actinomycetota bacterium]
MSTVIENRQVGSLAARLPRIADLSGTELWRLSDEQISQGVVEVAKVQSGIEHLMAELTAAAADRDLPALAGATSAAVWLAQLTGLSRVQAGKVVKHGEHLCDLVEETRHAWATGLVTTEQATIICKAVATLPDWVGVVERCRAEAHLLDLARSFPTDDLKRLANRVLEVIDPDGAEEHLGKQLEAQEHKAHDSTELAMWGAGGGMTRGRFLIPTVQASMLRSVLEGLASPRRNAPAIYDRDGEHSDAASGTITHQQKLGRAFCELIEHLPTDAMPQHGGLAASVTIAMTLDQLNDGLGTALLSTGEEVSAGQARRFACNAQLIPMVLDGDSKILDLGQSKRVYDRYQRIALAKRDRGCVWKGCDRPHSWTEAHHLVWHSRGGPTDLANGALFCFYHHHLLHNGEWDARIGADGVVEVIPPKRIDPDQKPIRHNRFKPRP